MMPVNGPITSGFGQRSSPGGVGSTNHQGVDIGVPIGTEVKAAGGARVAAAGTVSGYGNYIDLQHADGTVTRYGHLSKINVVKGQQVQQGDVIGLSGMSGTATGPHLHFEVRKNVFKPVDPTSQVNGLIISERSTTTDTTICSR